MNEMSGEFLELIQLKQVHVSHKSCTIFENGLRLRVTWAIYEVGFNGFSRFEMVCSQMDTKICLSNRVHDPVLVVFDSSIAAYHFCLMINQWLEK